MSKLTKPNPVIIGNTPVSVDITIQQGQVPNIGVRLLQVVDGEPESININGYNALMHVRPRVDSPTILLELSNYNGSAGGNSNCNGLAVDNVGSVVWIRPSLEQVNSLPTKDIVREWSYDLMLIQPSGGPVIAIRGTLTVLPRVTRVDLPNVSYDLPTVPDMVETIIQGIQGPRGEEGPEGPPGAAVDPDTGLSIADLFSLIYGVVNSDNLTFTTTCLQVFSSYSDLEDFILIDGIDNHIGNTYVVCELYEGVYYLKAYKVVYSYNWEGSDRTEILNYIPIIKYLGTAQEGQELYVVDDSAKYVYAPDTGLTEIVLPDFTVVDAGTY